jgi:CTD small phosphatase-like protein 2
MYREHCHLTQEGLYIKNLDIIENRDPNSYSLIDNAAHSFGFQLDNGIPIVPFYDEASDDEMLHLSNYLEVLAESDDMRIENRNAFHLSEISPEEIEKFLKRYCNNPPSNQDDQ